MKVLVISGDSTKDDFFYNAFSSVSERNELQICRCIIEADSFVARELILHQKQLDVIVTESFGSEQRSARDFCYDIRNDYARTFAGGNFKLSSIPIVLFHPERIDRDQYINFGFDEIVDSEDDFHFFNRILNVTKSVVKKWRNLVYEDLEVLKLGKEQNFQKASFQILRSKAEVTKILSDSYVRNQSKLDVTWFQRDHRKFELGLDLFQKRILEAEKSKRKEEKKFHRIVNSNPELLLRGSYGKHFYETSLPKTARHDALEPDYLLESYFSNGPMEVMEFKTPNEKFFEKSNFHRSLRKGFFKHIGQVKDYKDYLEDPDNEEYLKNTLGLKPIKLHYNLVIGRRSDFGSQASVYKRRERHFNLEEIKIITFDEFADSGERYHNEMLELSV